MKKVYLMVVMMIMTVACFAQIPNAGMEYWRTDTVGGDTGISGHLIMPVHAPDSWFATDSLVIALGQSFGAVAFGSADSDWHRQVFQESVKKHTGSYSAKVMTVYQDTILLPGIISNAVPSLIFSYAPLGITGLTLSGGTPTSVKPLTVSAWVSYTAGVDSSGYTGIDSGTLTAQAVSFIDGKDSVIGTATVVIGPDTGWKQVTANIVYTNDLYPVDTFRIAFASSKSASGLDSSTLYIDDISMTSEPNPAAQAAVTLVATGSNRVKVYPNPTSGYVFIDNDNDLNYLFYSVSGAPLAGGTAFHGHSAIDVSSLPDGMYFYELRGSDNVLQRGKIVLNR